jgi:rhamnosyltransferase
VSTPKISVVIPTRNGSRTLPKLVTRLWEQRFSGSLEITIVDSGSTDGTVDLVRDRVSRVIQIDRKTFNHGLTRNLGVEASSGDLVVLMVQDALPASHDSLARLVAPLVADETIGGTFARQQPRQKATPITRHYLARWVAATDTARTVSLEGKDAFDALTPAERLDRCAFDNVTSCIRRSVWRHHPFKEVTIAEDLEWGRDVLLAGHRLAYVPGAVVLHSHERSSWYEVRRTRALHCRLFELFELRTVPTVVSLGRGVVASAVRHVWLELGTPSRFPRALGLAVAWPLGQYLGARAAVRARRPQSRNLLR